MTITGYASFFIVTVLSFLTFMKLRSIYHLNFVYDKTDPESFGRYIDEKLKKTPWLEGIFFSYLLNIVVGFFLSGTTINEIGNDMNSIFNLAAVPTLMLDDFLIKILVD